jgi:hypothetical protein
MLTTLERQETIRTVVKKTRRCQLQARARGAIVTALVLFVFSQVGMNTVIEEWRPELRDPTFEIKYRRLTSLLSQHKQKPATVMFFGSSMSANGMKADVIEAPLAASLGRPVVGFNMATNGAGPLTQLIYMQRLLRRGVRPDLVVIELAPLFYEVGQAPIELRRFSGHVLEHPDLTTLEHHAAPSDLRNEWWQARLVPVHGHRLMILNQSARPLVPFSDRVELWAEADSHGWRRRPRPTPEEHRQILTEIEAQFKTRFANYKIDPVPLQALRELTDLLAKERIAALLVMMPEGPLLRSLYGPGVLTPLMGEFEALSRKHGFPLIQARDWLEEGKFVDSYHLNDEGAQEFTERLLREVLCPFSARMGPRERYCP